MHWQVLGGLANDASKYCVLFANSYICFSLFFCLVVFMRKTLLEVSTFFAKKGLVLLFINGIYQSRWKKWTVPIINEGIKQQKCPFFRFQQRGQMETDESVFCPICFTYSSRLHEIREIDSRIELDISLSSGLFFIRQVILVFGARFLNPFQI